VRLRPPARPSGRSCKAEKYALAVPPTHIGGGYSDLGLVGHAGYLLTVRYCVRSHKNNGAEALTFHTSMLTTGTWGRASRYPAPYRGPTPLTRPWRGSFAPIPGRKTVTNRLQGQRGAIITSEPPSFYFSRLSTVASSLFAFR